jgi:excisionase family DNA binding protein
VDEKYMTTKEAGKELGVCPRTISRWIDGGKLKGKRTMFGRVASRAAVERQKAEKAGQS